MLVLYDRSNISQRCRRQSKPQVQPGHYLTPLRVTKPTTVKIHRRDPGLDPRVLMKHLMNETPNRFRVKF